MAPVLLSTMMDIHGPTMLVTTAIKLPPRPSDQICGTNFAALIAWSDPHVSLTLKICIHWSWHLSIMKFAPPNSNWQPWHTCHHS